MKIIETKKINSNLMKRLH